MIRSICEQRPNVGTSKILLLEDNSGAHKVKVTVTFVKERGIRILYHFLYGPDVPQCRFWLFPNLKNMLARRKFLRV